ncbi:hypothetical protein CC77DRAFT_1016075 [Alternaria alternata]|uniref:Uncharacterized protein n=1 Tax=Alternaria alternata TaxID=5599 RepID=A0A177E0X4_ALTAL|nr:hypothetical protein CC77DRAFT_1016075 [Alternaria alternata]OAG25060.1 hypothetical protein CC77DRAFT_1016075 [Alternaria alternata]
MSWDTKFPSTAAEYMWHMYSLSILVRVTVTISLDMFGRLLPMEASNMFISAEAHRP